MLVNLTAHSSEVNSPLISMDKKRRRSKGNKSNKHTQLAQTPNKVSTFDTSGLPDHISSWFKDADDRITSRYSILNKHEHFLTAAKDQAIRDIDFCFDKLVLVANRRRQLVKSEVSDMYTNQHEELLEKKENVLLSGMLLETLLKQAKEMSSSSQTDKMEGFEEMVQREIERHCSAAHAAIPDASFIEFDKTVEVTEPLERKLRTVGKVKTDCSLPTTISLEDCSAVAGLGSNITLEIFDAVGEALSPSLIRIGLLSLQLKDPKGEVVPHRLDKTNNDKLVRVFFTPTTPEKHVLSFLFSSHIFKEIEIEVRENSPTMSLGRRESLLQPNALCSLKDGRVCIADSGSGKLLLFSSAGSLLAEVICPDSSFVPFDVSAVPKANILMCTGSAYDDQDDTLSASPDGCENSPPLEMNEETTSEEASELPRDREKVLAIGGTGVCSRNHEACSSGNEDLNILESLLDDVSVKFVEKRAYITINTRNQIILGEVNSNTISVYDMEGHFLRIIPSPNLDCLGSIQCKPDGQVIVSDIGNSKLLTGTPDMGLCEQWGSLETEAKQLLLPLGLALDEVGNLLVADGGGPRVFIYGEWGEYVGRLELGAHIEDIASSSDGAESEESSSHSRSSLQTVLSVIPWALTVTSGSIWVIDNNSHKVLRYNYNTPA